MDRVSALDLDPLDQVGPGLSTVIVLRVLPRFLEGCLQGALFLRRVACPVHMVMVRHCAPPFGREPTPPRTLCLDEYRRPSRAGDVPLAVVNRLRPDPGARSFRRPGFPEDAREPELRGCLQVEEVGRRGQVDRLACEYAALGLCPRARLDLRTCDPPHHLCDDVVLPGV